MEFSAFAQFGIIIALAAALGIIASKLKQPPILGYIFTGLIIGPLTPFFNPDSHSIELLSKVGIAFLLFTLGLELDVTELKRLGRTALFIGLGQIIFTSIIGYIVAVALGFSSVAAVYIAIGLTFSSTIVIIKLLSQGNKLDTLYGRISIGFLLVQDFVAIILLIGLTAFRSVTNADLSVVLGSLVTTLGKGILAVCLIYVFVKFVLFPILNSIKMEKEVLFLTAIAWALLVASIFESQYVGFSIEVGGLIAGIALSNRYEHLQIESWTKPLRDFFLILFFILLGANIQVSSITAALPSSLILSGFVLIGNPLIVMLILAYLGYNKKISFLTSLSVAQISEFSLILISFAYKDLGQVDNVALTMMTLVGGITMTISSYMIYYNEEIYEKLKNYLNFLNFNSHKNAQGELENENFHSDSPKEVVLFGCHRMGRSLLNLIPDEKENILIVDFDPINVRQLRTEGYDALYADMSDLSIYEDFKLNEAVIVISTVPSFKDNKVLMNYLRGMETQPMTIIMANDNDSAKMLYEIGADLVIYPHLLGGEMISQIVKRKSLDKEDIRKRASEMEFLGLM